MNKCLVHVVIFLVSKVNVESGALPRFGFFPGIVSFPGCRGLRPFSWRAESVFPSVQEVNNAALSYMPRQSYDSYDSAIVF